MPSLREQVVHLTKDGIWPWAIPAEVGEPWPDGDAHTRFMNSAGAQIADITATEVTPSFIRFLAQPEQVADIPAGAKFETFIETDDGPLKIRYGTVMRPEATFYNTPASTTMVAKLFADSLQRSALGTKWEPVYGSTKMYNNADDSLPYGVGPNTGLFSGTKSAIRWHEQFSGDSIEASLTLILPPSRGGNNGKTCYVLCADQNFTTGLAVEFNSIDADTLRFARVTSPTTVVYLAAAISDTIADHNNYRVRFTHLTKTLSVYKGTNLSPMSSWVDADDIMPHGNGYRHTGFMFSPTHRDTGPQVSGWSAKDAV